MSRRLTYVFAAVGLLFLSLMLQDRAPKLFTVVLIGLWVFLIIFLIWHWRLLPEAVMQSIEARLKRYGQQDSYPELLAEFQRQKKTLDADDLFASLIEPRTGIAGQDEPLSFLAHDLAQRARLSVKDQFLGVYCIPGPPGVGKTLTGPVLAQSLFGSRDACLKIPCGGMKAEDLTKWLGSPPGYQGSEQLGEIAATLIANPQTVLLLDELEKAPEELRDALLSLLQGEVPDRSAKGRGRKIPVNQAVVLMTTNARHAEVSAAVERYAADPETLSGVLRDVYAQEWKEELVDRINHFLPFRALLDEAIGTLAADEAERLAETLGLSIRKVSAEFMIAANQAHRDNRAKGARQLARWVRTAVSKQLMAAADDGATVVDIEMQSGQPICIAIEYEEKRA